MFVTIHLQALYSIFPPRFVVSFMYDHQKNHKSQNFGSCICIRQTFLYKYFITQIKYLLPAIQTEQGC